MLLERYKMQQKKKIVLLPSAYSHRAMGDIENFIKYYRDYFEVYVITDLRHTPGAWETIEDGVHYVYKGAPQAYYLIIVADYIIDAGTVGGDTKINESQKRISVWHGIPYKKMFVDYGREHIVTALDYTYGFDLMVSPSQWYSNHFLRDSMLYDGPILETAVSRTDSLYLSDSEKSIIRDDLGIPEGNKILLYAPTFRDRGGVELPFSPQKVLDCLKGDWTIVVKLHYLNSLPNAEGVIDATHYPLVNNLLAVSDLLVTDYSSLLFDYSVLDKAALLFQYDRDLYENERGFMFNMEDFVSRDYIVFNEESFYNKLGSIDLQCNNLSLIHSTFYPWQHKDATKELIEGLNLDYSVREVEEVVFLVNDLNQIGGVHSFIINLAKELKAKYNSRIIVIGGNEFPPNNDTFHLFDPDNIIDIKLSGENDARTANAILENTNGYIISCQYSVHLKFQGKMKNKKAILMFHGDTKDVVDRNMYEVHLDAYNEGKIYNYRRLALLTEANCELLKDHLVDEVKEKAIYIENGIDFADTKNLYKESGQFAFVSRLDPDKNVFEVIDIFTDPKLNENYHLHIYGDGSLRQEVEDLIASRQANNKITLHGFVSDKEQIYQDKQGVVLTSLSEGLPLTIIESIKYGIPVYSYDSFTACRDVVIEECGVLIETGNKEAYVEALNVPFDIANFDRTIIINRFSNTTITQKWKNIFDELDTEVAAEEEAIGAARALQGKKSIKRKWTWKKKRKEKLSRRFKDAVRNSALFRNNDRYAELSAKWREIKRREKSSSLPLVSIVMPFFNNQDTVLQAVQSVERCGYKNYEIVLVNDGSPVPMPEQLKTRKKVRYFEKENGGLSSARNFGMDHAEGKYVIFLDSDDVFYPGGLGKLVRYAERNELEMVCGKTKRQHINQDRSEVWYPSLYTRNYINTKQKRHLIVDDTIATAKLFKLASLKEMGVRFKDGLYEDVLFTGELYARFEEIGVISGLVQKWLIYGEGQSITTRLTLENARARLKNVDTVFEMHTDVMKVYLTRQYIRHTAVACIYGFCNMAQKEQKELFSLLCEGIKMREPYIVDSLIALPSKKMLYRALLEGDYGHFALIAEGYSHKYAKLHETGNAST